MSKPQELAQPVPQPPKPKRFAAVVVFEASVTSDIAKPEIVGVKVNGHTLSLRNVQHRLRQMGAVSVEFRDVQDPSARESAGLVKTVPASALTKLAGARA